MPTTVAIADGEPATVYVGTTDRGVLASTDGQTWTLANDGLGMSPGTRLHVDALAVDPVQPDRLYVAASYLLGSATVHQTPSQIAMSANGAETWTSLDAELGASVAELMPVSGRPGAVYALTTGIAHAAWRSTTSHRRPAWLRLLAVGKQRCRHVSRPAHGRRREPDSDVVGDRSARSACAGRLRDDRPASARRPSAGRPRIADADGHTDAAHRRLESDAKQSICPVRQQRAGSYEPARCCCRNGPNPLPP